MAKGEEFAVKVKLSNDLAANLSNYNFDTVDVSFTDGTVAVQADTPTNTPTPTPTPTVITVTPVPPTPTDSPTPTPTDDVTPTPEFYTVTFDTQGGSEIESEQTVPGGTVKQPENPLRNGWFFDAWYTTDSYETLFDFYAPVNSDVTVYAKWSDSQQGCYVATAVYGSYDCPEVWTLRRFRDEVLAQSWYGRLFIRAYYTVSPTVVRLFGETEWFQNFWRGKLDRMVSGLQADGFASTPYKDIDW